MLTLDFNIFLTDQLNKYAWTEENKEAIKESGF